MPRAALAAVALALAVVALAACGAGERRTRPPAVEGPAVFARACSMCHTLGTDAGGHGPVGGSLRRYGLSVAQVERLTRVMPVAHPLSAAELRAVSAYVAAVEQGATPGP